MDIGAEKFTAPDWLMQGLLSILYLGFPLVVGWTWRYGLELPSLNFEDGEDAFERPELGVQKLAASFAPPEHSVAVMAFSNHSGDDAHDYFADGIAEDVLNLLARIPELKISAKTSSFSFRDQQTDARTIARRLNVAYLLEGSVRIAGKRLRLSTQLIKAEDGFQVWSESFDRVLEDVFAVQDEVAEAITAALKINLLTGTPQARTTSTECYALFLQGLHEFDKGNQEGMVAALDLLQRALAMDPDYPPTLVYLAGAYMYHFNLELMSREAAIPLARSLLMRAIATDKGDGNAHSTLAYLMMAFERDPEGAKDHIERALEFLPGDARVLRRANAVFTFLGNSDRALELGLRSVELDPINPAGFSNVAITQLLRKDYSAAIEFGQRAIDLAPGISSTRLAMGMAAVKLNDIALAGELAAAEPNEAGKLILQCLVSIEEGAFDEGAFNTLRSEHGEHWPYHVALVYAHRRYVDNAFEWLYKAVELRDGSVGQAIDDPFLTHLHTDPRWPEFLEKLSA